MLIKRRSVLKYIINLLNGAKEQVIQNAITMKVLIIYAHPNPMSFTHAKLDNFVRGLEKGLKSPWKKLLITGA